MHAVIKKWGNSLSVRLPAVLTAEAHLKEDAEVDIRIEAGRIIIEPIRSNHYDLQQLIAGITPNNLHSEVSFGPAVGREAL